MDKIIEYIFRPEVFDRLMKNLTIFFVLGGAIVTLMLIIAIAMR